MIEAIEAERQLINMGYDAEELEYYSNSTILRLYYGEVARDMTTEEKKELLIEKECLVDGDLSNDDIDEMFDIEFC